VHRGVRFNQFNGADGTFDRGTNTIWRRAAESQPPRPRCRPLAGSCCHQPWRAARMEPYHSIRLHPDHRGRQHAFELLDFVEGRFLTSGPVRSRSTHTDLRLRCYCHLHGLSLLGNKPLKPNHAMERTAGSPEESLKGKVESRKLKRHALSPAVAHLVLVRC
jgi:hypothetical protein